jgi:hypothetical protein
MLPREEPRKTKNPVEVSAGQSVPIYESKPLKKARNRVALIHAWTSLTRNELLFWETLESALSARGFSLILTGPVPPPAGFAIPYVQFPSSLEAIPMSLIEQIPIPRELTVADCTINELLKREIEWVGEPATPTAESHRVRSLIQIEVFYRDIINQISPDVVAVWNGHHPIEMILNGLCESANIPRLFLERGPIPGTLFLDPEGILADSGFAKNAAFDKTPKRRLQLMRRVSKWYDPSRLTWWDQPESGDAATLRDRLGIPAGAKVLLFAGQVDADTQCFKFSPLFSSNLEAFQWFCSHLPSDENVFVLGKHHPKATVAPDAFAEVVGKSGVWATDVPLSDCLTLADRVAAVNSTVLFEAMLLGKPSLSMGLLLAAQSNVFYEVVSRESGGETIRDWLKAGDFQNRLDRFAMFGARLLQHSLFAFNPELEELGVPGPAKMALRLVEDATAATPGGFASVSLRSIASKWNFYWDAGLKLECLSRQVKELQRLLTNSREERLEAILWQVAFESTHRPTYLWGAGAGGRETLKALEGRGARIAGFIDGSLEKAGSRIKNLEVLTPRELSGLRLGKRPFVALATLAASEIEPELHRVGLVKGRDYVLVDVDCLVKRRNNGVLQRGPRPR